MKKAYSVVVIVLTALLSVVTWALIRKTTKIKKRQYKTDEKIVKSVEDNEIPTENTIVTEEVNTVAIEDDALVGSMNKKNEDINAKQDQHIMTKSQFIKTAAIIAAPVATLITAFIAFLALKESMLQRENMYRPELYIGETKYMADISDMSNIKYYQIVKDSILRDKQVRSPYLKINNIGMGTALHVDGETTFRWEESNPLLSNLKMPHKNGTQSYGDVYMHGNDSIVLPAATGSMRWKTDYIMSIAQIGEGYMEQLFAPNFRSIIEVSSWLMKIINSPVMYFTFPIELSYKDINDKCYLRKREILIKCSKSSKSKDEFYITICSGQAHREFQDEMKKMMRPEEK